MFVYYMHPALVAVLSLLDAPSSTLLLAGTAALAVLALVSLAVLLPRAGRKSLSQGITAPSRTVLDKAAGEFVKAGKHTHHGAPVAG
jgi:hypothetical protein